jgi:hypothetical protein
MGCLAVVAVAGLATGMAPAARAVPGTAVVHGTWHQGQLVPGVAVLNAGGDAAVTAVACTAPGYCTAGGYYTPAGTPPKPAVGIRRTFVATEVKGHWGTAIGVPGTGAGDLAAVTAVACTSPGNCVAGGYDGFASTGIFYGFVASEVNGLWHTAHRLSTGQLDETTAITSVSCSKAGECLAGGWTQYVYDPDRGYPLGREIVTDERNGAWGALRSLNGDSLSYMLPTSVACASPGNCAAGVGTDGGPPRVAQEANGTWHNVALPGFPANSYNRANTPTVVACPKAGACTAGGTFDGAPVGYEVWVASETGYKWGNYADLPGLHPGAISAATVSAISCTAPGYCTLAGQFWSTASPPVATGFTAAETAGHWSSARLVVFGATGNAPSVSCPAPGYCVAAIGTTSWAPHVIEQAGGTWGRPLALPGLTRHPGQVSSVSCAKPGWCAAGGSYSSGGLTQAILADETAA